MAHLARLTWLEFKLFLRNPPAVFFTLIFPLLILTVFGSIFGNRPIPGQPGGYMDASVPGYMAMIVGSLGFMGVPGWIATYREQGIFRRLKMTPIRPIALLTAQGMVGFAGALAGTGLLVVVGMLAFGLRAPAAPLDMIAALFIGYAAIFSLGALLGAVARTARAAQAAGMAFYFPMLFLSGAALPRALMPPGVRRVADFLPLTHVTELLGGLWIGAGWRLVSLAVLGGVLLVAGALAARNFRWE